MSARTARARTLRARAHSARARALRAPRPRDAPSEPAPPRARPQAIEAACDVVVPGAKRKTATHEVQHRLNGMNSKMQKLRF